MELRYVEGKDWAILLFVGIFVVLAVVRTKFPRRFKEFMLLPITNKYFGIEGRIHEATHPFSLSLFGVQAISISLFITLLLSVGEPHLSFGILLFFQVITGYVVFVLFKYYIEKLIAHVLDMEGVINVHLFEKLSYLNLLSLFVLCLNLIFYFVLRPNPSILYITTLVLIVLYGIILISSFKKLGVLIFRNFFYFILYLCALEFAPYIILYKMAV
ncbi:MAG: DUF4271 domain-containing protein [Flavobacteriaceae bacterium]